jgi:hypothetical protein
MVSCVQSFSVAVLGKECSLLKVNLSMNLGMRISNERDDFISYFELFGSNVYRVKKRVCLFLLI